jgi:hypothetical protein
VDDDDESVPVDDDDKDCPSVDVDGIEYRAGATLTVGAEVTVHCCDGTDFGESLELDLGPSSLPVEEMIEAFEEFVRSQSDELFEGCPEEPDDWVEDGEGELA